MNPAGAKPQAPKPQARIESMLLLRGVPFQSTPADIINFFGDFKPQAATTCADTHGRNSGEALVEFSDATSCSAAFALKQGGHIGSRYIELFQATQDDIVRMRPLKTATAAELAEQAAAGNSYGAVSSKGFNTSRSNASPYDIKGTL